MENNDFSKNEIEFVPDFNSDSNTIVNKLKQVSKVGYPSFKVIVNDQKICIRTPRYNILAFFLSVIHFFIFIMLIIESNHNFIVYILFVLATFYVLLLYRFRSFSNDFEIELDKKIIKIKNNNFIGKLVLPKIELSFEEFIDFTYKKKVIRNSEFFIIFIYYRDSKKGFIQLSTSIYSELQILIFIDCLTRLIKNDKLIQN